jgi:L-ascorbate metabolism protein UlaG (beta-lactamase superfamily)
MMSLNDLAGPTSKTDLAEAADTSKAIYLGNEAILVEHKNKKKLFDPFFQNGFNTYQLVPLAIRQSLFKGEPPYHNIDAIFISHAHGDHFAATDLVRFLTAFPGTKVIAPSQAIDQIKALSRSKQVSTNLIAIDRFGVSRPTAYALIAGNHV